jgi:hypothetical protein
MDKMSNRAPLTPRLSNQRSCWLITLIYRWNVESPLHYLIFCGAETILPRLFRQVVIPPTVFRELQQTNTPPLVRQRAASLPAWIAVQTPKTVNLMLDVVQTLHRAPFIN